MDHFWVEDGNQCLFLEFLVYFVDIYVIEGKSKEITLTIEGQICTMLGIDVLWNVIVGYAGDDFASQQSFIVLSFFQFGQGDYFQVVFVVVDRIGDVADQFLQLSLLYLFLPHMIHTVL